MAAAEPLRAAKRRPGEGRGSVLRMPAQAPPGPSEPVRPEVFYDALSALVGQDPLRLKLASVFFQYTLHLVDPDAGRPNLLVYGRSGSGKTYAVERCIAAAGLPMTIASAAALAPPGFRGRVLLDVLIDHWRKWRTDRGVIFLDEIDKLCAGAMNVGGRASREVSELEKGGVAMQQELLKHVESNIVTFNDEAKDLEDLADVEFDTGNILWIFGGAFVGIDRAVRARNRNPHMSEEDAWEHAIPADFKRYGMTPEFADRVQTWAWTKPLKVQQMMQILREQDQPRWERRFRALGLELELQEGALGVCAQHAWEMHEGPRVARAMLTRSMDDVLALASRHLVENRGWHGRVVVDPGTVRNGTPSFDASDRG